MKKLFVLAFLATSLFAYAGEVNDENEKDGGVQLEKKKADDPDRWFMHLAVGVNVPTGAPSGVDFAPFRSWDINLTIAQYEYTPKGASQTYSVGVGVEWRNYTLSGHDKAFEKIDDFTDVYHVDSKDHVSRVQTFNINIPLLFQQRFAKDFAVSLGAQVNINTQGILINKWEDGDNDYDVTTKKIGQRPLTVDVLGMVHFKEVALYCKYSPMSVFKKDRGPKFQSFAFGIYF